MTRAADIRWLDPCQPMAGPSSQVFSGKGGTAMPQLYRARAYFQQTIGLGGKKVWKSSDPMQLESKIDSSRLVLSVGNFTILDFVDKNEFAGDLRQQFFDMAFMTHSAYRQLLTQGDS